MEQENKEETQQSIEITKMTVQDLDNVITLGKSSAEIQTGTDSPQFYSKETLSKWVGSRNGILLVAKIQSEFAGFIITSYNPDSRDAYVHTVDVVKKFRVKGVGDQLLEETLQELEQTDCNHVFCLVKPNNTPSRRLFQKHGFTIGKMFAYTDITLPR